MFDVIEFFRPETHSVKIVLNVFQTLNIYL